MFTWSAGLSGDGGPAPLPARERYARHSAGRGLHRFVGDLRAGGPLAEDLVQVIDELAGDQEVVHHDRLLVGLQAAAGAMAYQEVCSGQLAGQQELLDLPPRRHSYEQALEDGCVVEGIEHFAREELVRWRSEFVILGRSA